MASASTWAVYRRTPEGLDRVTVVMGAFEGSAMDAACRISGGPRHPIVAHAYTGAHELTDFSLIPAPARRSRRHAS